MLLAVPLLGERVSLAGWIGAAAAFAGVILIVRPGSGLASLDVTFALLNAGLGTAYHLLTRGLARTESTEAMLFYVALVGTVAFGVALPWSGDGPSLSALDFGLLLGLGTSATLGHFLFTTAYREAPASLLAPVNHMHLAWAAGMGWLAFGHVPDILSCAGITLVAAAGMATAFKARPAQA